MPFRRFIAFATAVLFSGPAAAQENPSETTTPLDFKWADNLPPPVEAMDFYSRGAVMPAGRFNFRYAAP